MMVLIVDDEQGHRTLLRILMKRAGYQAIFAADGVEGLQMARDHQPILVILDHRMPKMKGSEMCHAIKSDPATQHIPVLIYSAAQHPETISEWRESGADGILFKPCQPPILMSTIAQLLQPGAVV
jgi:CheY-like chemotaxis protein